MKSAKVPSAFEPPPMQASTASGSRPYCAVVCSAISLLITRWNSRTILGKGCGPATVPIR